MIELKSVLFLLSISHYTCGFGLQAGPIGFYDIIDVQMVKCPNGCKGTLHMNVVKDGNTKLLAGNFTLPYDFDKTFTFQVNIDRWSGTEWKNDVFKLNGLACENMLKMSPNIYADIMGHLEPKLKSKECFIPKGTYTIDKIQAKASDVKLPSLIYSKYRGKVTLYKGSDEIVCFTTVLSAEQ